MSTELTVRCTLCGAEFTDEQIRDATCCPNCRHTGVPMAIADDVQVRINWHELRILVMWAHWWAERHKTEHPAMVPVVASIAERIAEQHLDKGPLTFAGDISKAREELGLEITIVKDGKPELKE